MKQRLLAFALTLVMIFTFGLTGCQKSPDDKGDSNGVQNQTVSTKPTGTSDKPVSIRWFQNLRGDINPETDPILKEIEKKLNIEFDFVVIPGVGEEQVEKLKLMVATGEPLDLITHLSGIDAVIKQWVTDGVLLAFDDYTSGEKYPMVNSIIHADIYQDYVIDGKIYFKAMPNTPGGRGYVIRTDWLEAVGMEMPTTIDEYYDVMKAFVENDPDGNGKNDTYGFFVAEPQGSNAFSYISRAFVDCPVWGFTWCRLPDGSITQYIASDGAREAFRFIKKCYDDGLFNKSFLNEKDAEGKMDDLLVSQKVGMMDITAAGVSGLVSRFEKAGQTAAIGYLPPLNMVDGSPGTLPTSSSYGFHMIPKTCKDVDKVLELLEWALTEEARELTMYGIKGLTFDDYTITDTARVYNVRQDDMKKYWNTDDFGFSYPLTWGALNYNGGYFPIAENNYDFDAAFRLQENWTDNTQYGGVLGNLRKLNSQYISAYPLQDSLAGGLTWNQRLVDIEMEGRTRAIIEPVEQFDAIWDEMLARWMAEGGTDIIVQGNEAWELINN